MKQIYFFPIAIGILVLFTLKATAQTRPVNTVVSLWGQWSDKNGWSLNRVPKNGDSIVVPAGTGIVLDKNENLDNVFISVRGVLVVRKKLTLDQLSTISIGAGGILMGFGADRNNETITLGGVVKFDERAPFLIGGPAYANRNTLTSPSGFVFAALNVKYLGFTATFKNTNVELNWSTEQETNNSHFNIERSFDGRSWSTIGVIMGNGTTNQLHKYSYTDKKFEQAMVHYRLRQVDLDGKYEFSAIKTVRNNETNSAVNIYASSKQQIAVDLNKEVKGQLVVRVLNTNGQLVAQQTFTNASYRVNLSTGNNASGLYIVQVTDGRGWSESKKVVL